MKCKDHSYSQCFTIVFIIFGCNFSQSDLRTRLLHSMKGISHESLDVRLHALSKLKKLLRDEKVR